MKINNSLGEEAEVKSSFFSLNQKESVDFKGMYNGKEFVFLKNVGIRNDRLVDEDGKMVKFPEYTGGKDNSGIKVIEDCFTDYKREILDKKIKIPCDWDANNAGVCNLNGEFKLFICFYDNDTFNRLFSAKGGKIEIYSDDEKLMESCVPKAQVQITDEFNSLICRNELSQMGKDLNAIFLIFKSDFSDKNDVYLKNNVDYRLKITFYDKIHNYAEIPECEDINSKKRKVYFGKCYVKYDFVKVCPMGYRHDKFESSCKWME